MENLHAFSYRILGRLQADLKYYWGNGNQCERHLFYGNYEKHMQETIRLWKKLPIKPVWFRAKELIYYKNLNNTTKTVT